MEYSISIYTPLTKFQRPQSLKPAVQKVQDLAILGYGNRGRELGAKLVSCVKELSNVKEEVYGALDSFIAWELEFNLITVKKALKILQNEQEWKRINSAEDGIGRLDEPEELWAKIFSDNLESTPRIFFDKIISIYYHRGMHEKMFEAFADMEELGVKPGISVVSVVGNVFQQLGMLDKYDKLKTKYPPPKWEYRYIKGKPVKIRVKQLQEFDKITEGVTEDKETEKDSSILQEEAEASSPAEPT
ncbi:hypothetical protein PTKIN_Ptkin04bG0139700 [Pterospermum kingtungense]